MSKIVASTASADSLEPTDVRASAGTMMITFGPYMNTGPALGDFATLTHWDWKKIVAISQKTFWNEFSWIRISDFRLTFRWLAPNMQQAIIWTKDDLFHWQIYASLGLNELTSQICFHQDTSELVIRRVTII